MSKARRSDLVFGIVLFLIGGWFLLAKLNVLPGIEQFVNMQTQWPLIIIGVGVFLFLLALLARAPGLSVPACIAGGIGGILLWQNATDQFETWSYMWALIPGFVGVGVILSTLLFGEGTQGYKSGLRLILISAILFIIFFILTSGQTNIIMYWPILVILGGIWIIITAIFRRK